MNYIIQQSELLNSNIKPSTKKNSNIKPVKLPYNLTPKKHSMYSKYKKQEIKFTVDVMEF